MGRGWGEAPGAEGSGVAVIETAERVTPWFTDVGEGLGLGRDDVGGLTGLIGLLIYMKPRSYHQALRYLGLFRARGADGRRWKKCSKMARRYLVMLAESLHRRNGEIWPPRLRDLRKLLRTVVSLVRELEPAGV